MNNDFDNEFQKIASDNQSPLNQGVPEKVHFRCPSCSKLFAANPSYINTEKPEFTCNSCATEFWISFSEALSLNEVIGYKIEKEVDFEEEKPLKSDDQGIFNQTLHVENFEQEREESEKPQSSILDDLKGLIDEVNDSDMEFIDNQEKTEREPTQKDMWSNVLGEYSDLSLHDEFINFCYEADDIGYAAEKYKSMLDMNQHDQVARLYLNKIKLSTVNQARNESQTRIANTQMNGNVGAFAAAAIGLGALFVVLGFTIAPLQNLVGLGIAIIFFTFAVQALLYKSE